MKISILLIILVTFMVSWVLPLDVKAENKRISVEKKFQDGVEITWVETDQPVTRTEKAINKFNSAVSLTVNAILQGGVLCIAQACGIFYPKNWSSEKSVKGEKT